MPWDGLTNGERVAAIPEADLVAMRKKLPPATWSGVFDQLADLPNLKRCSKCKASKPFSEFDKQCNKRTKNPKWLLKSWCKECLRDHLKTYRNSSAGKATRDAFRDTDKYRAQMRTKRLKECYGMTPEDYEALLTEQDGKCAICRQEETLFDPRAGKIRRLAVDHDHETEQNRGLLCNNCNRAVGLFGDSLERLRAAVAYLEKYGL